MLMETSEKTVLLLEGALLYAKLMQTSPRTLESDEACTAWEDWAQRAPAYMVQMSRDLKDSVYRDVRFRG